MWSRTEYTKYYNIRYTLLSNQHILLCTYISVTVTVIIITTFTCEKYWISKRILLVRAITAATIMNRTRSAGKDIYTNTNFCDLDLYPLFSVRWEKTGFRALNSKFYDRIILLLFVHSFIMRSNYSEVEFRKIISRKLTFYYNLTIKTFILCPPARSQTVRFALYRFISIE